MSIIGTGVIKFQGSSDYLKIPYHSMFEVTANYTIEFRVDFNDLSLDAELFGFANSGHGIMIRWNELASGKIKVYHGVSGSWTSFESSVNPFASANTWYHVAVVNNAGSQTIYVDGVSVGTGSLSNPTYTSTNDLYIGCEYIPDTDDYNLSGFLEEYRFSNTARYTSGFTPPSVTHTTDANTLLLLKGEGSHGDTFIEDSAQNSSAVQLVFGTGFGVFQTGYSNLRLPDHVDLAFGTNDFTIEFRMLATKTPTGNDRIVSTTVWDANGGYLICLSSNLKLRFYDGNTNALEIESDSAISLYTWYHVALSRSSGTLKMFVDGVEQTQTHSSSNYNVATMAIGDNLTIGAEGFEGLLDEFRVSDNARFTTGFTPSASAYTDDANTLVLLHMDGSTGDTTFTNSGTAMSFPKFGTGAGYFDGTTSKLEISDHSDFDFGSGDFTIDVWICPTVIGSYESIISNRSSASDQSFALYTKGTTQLRFGYSYNGSTWTDFDFTLPSSLQLYTWQHIAVVRDSTTIYAYLDGVQCSNSATVGTNTLFNATGNLTIGTDPRFGNYFDGYMDELRISKGTAEWTTGFTPPSSEYADSTYELTLHMNGTLDSTTFTDSGVTGHTVTVTDTVIKTKDPTVNGRSVILEEGNPVFAYGDVYISDKQPRLYETQYSLQVDINTPTKTIYATQYALQTDIYTPTRNLFATQYALQVDINTESVSNLKYWDGAAWTAKPLKYWDGAAWTTKPLKYWDGAAWS